MKKTAVLVSVLMILVGCSSHAVKYAEVSDVIRVETQVKKNRFAVKRALLEIKSLKEAIKEINHQLEKQNRINQELASRIKELQKEKKKSGSCKSSLKIKPDLLSYKYFISVFYGSRTGAERVKKQLEKLGIDNVYVVKLKMKFYKTRQWNVIVPAKNVEEFFTLKKILREKGFDVYGFSSAQVEGIEGVTEGERR